MEAPSKSFLERYPITQPLNELDILPSEIKILPPELIDYIFACMPFNKIHLMLGTCKSWRQIGENQLNILFPIRKKENNPTPSEEDKIKISDYVKKLAEEQNFKGALHFLRNSNILSIKKTSINEKSKTFDPFLIEALDWAFENKSFPMAFYPFDKF